VERVLLHGGDNNWIWRQTRNGISFECVWPGRYADRYLWSGVDRVILLSGTLVPKALQILRIPATEYFFREWPWQFPKANSPVWWVKTGKMRHGSSEEELEKCVAAGDRIFNTWGKKYKGLVHSQSYTRAAWLQSKCAWGRHMMINERGDATGTLERFLAAEPPAVLVSPSYTTGTDLADEACRWIWIPKLPFPDRSDPLVIARMEDDDEYYQYETMQTLVQASRRATRSETDWSVVMITDDAVGNFRNYARRFAPRWFEVKEWRGKGVPYEGT
jgi:Rad3-related DNA helicase